MNIPHSFITELKNCAGENNVLTDPTECVRYSQDDGRHHALPDVVAFVTTHSQVVKIIQACVQYHIPLTARGAGTGTPGGAIPIHGGLVLSFEKMNKILKIDPANRLMIVEPGVTNLEVQKKAAEHGLFFAPDPGSAEYCTIAGNMACNAAGPRAIKYGSTRENTLGLLAVTGAGEEIRTGTYTTKGSVGYDLTRLLIGSEGTLALITEATLKLLPLPETSRTLRATYTSTSTATDAVIRIMNQPNTPCALEFLDNKSMAILREAEPSLELHTQAHALLIIEIDGPVAAIDAISHQIANAAKNKGLLSLDVAKDEIESKKLWAARKKLSPALRKIAPQKISEDVVVPVSAIPKLISQVEKLSEKYQLNMVSFGHAGNGNIHVNLLIDPTDRVQAKKTELCLSDLFDAVITLQGTLSGEHGIGIEKREHMKKALSPTTLNLMQKIKAQFDPQGILNPGKIFPELGE